MAPVPRTTLTCLPAALDAAVERITRAALRPGPVGRVGLELEGHLVDVAAPGRRVRWPEIRTVLDGLGVLPGRSRVTVEPGGQVELSGPPAPDVDTAVAASVRGPSR